jgi:hypothetical protein
VSVCAEVIANRGELSHAPVSPNPFAGSQRYALLPGSGRGSSQESG